MTVWHLDPAEIRRYAQGAAPPESAASVEAHLMKCALCRDAIGSHVDARRSAAIWHEVVDRVEDTEFGRFGWAVDGDGRRFELWQPPTGGYPG